MPKPGLSFVDWMVELLPYNPDVPSSILSDGPDFFGFEQQQPPPSSQQQAKDTDSIDAS